MQSARSKANTEPDFVNRIGGDPRPISSTQLRRTWKETDIPDADIVPLLGRSLGVSLDSPVSSDWIVRDCFMHLRDEGWRCTKTQSGEEETELMFEHIVSGEKRSDHEVVINYRELSSRITYEARKLSKLRQEADYRLRELVFNRFVSQRNPQTVTSPELLESLFTLLKIQSSTEYYLVSTVRNVVESAYKRMLDNGGPETVTVFTCLDTESLMIRIGLQRIQIMKRISSTGLIFCVECKIALADGACATCGDCLCACCHSRLHAKGKRRDHLFCYLNQAVCAECEHAAASIRCNECADLFCKTCFSRLHFAGKSNRHTVQFPFPLHCLMCQLSEATCSCQECSGVFCAPCCQDIHKDGMHHEIQYFKDLGEPDTFFAANAGSVLKQLEVALSTPLPSAWERFVNHDFEPFWYNFFTKERKQVGDDSGPVDPPDVRDEIESRVRKICNERGEFVVPPRIQIRFQPSE